jgi:hypothetical protein
MKPELTAKKGVSLNDKLTRFWLLSILFVTIVPIIFIVAVSHLILKPLNEVVTPPESASSEDVFVSYFTLLNESEFHCSKSLEFAMEIASADPLERTLILDWFPLSTSGCANATSLIVDVFVNE